MRISTEDQRSVIEILERNRGDIDETGSNITPRKCPIGNCECEYLVIRRLTAPKEPGALIAELRCNYKPAPLNLVTFFKEPFAHLFYKSLGNKFTVDSNEYVLTVDKPGGRDYVCPAGWGNNRRINPRYNP